jgi:hypothetical protein
MLAVVTLLALALVAPARAEADDATAFYTPIASAASVPKPDWTAVLAKLQQVRIEWIDYRFFYHRARAFYALGETRAGDSDAAICRAWAKVLPTVEQTTIAGDLQSFRDYSVKFAIGHLRPGIIGNGLQADHVDHDR